MAVSKKQKLFLAGMTLLTLLFMAALACNVSPYLRGPDEWRWAYALPGSLARHSVPVLVVGGYCAAMLYLVRRSENRMVRIALWCAALSTPLIQAALLFPDSPDILRPLFYRTVSAGASGVFTVGSTIADLGSFLRQYPTLMPTFPVHPQRYPPGLPALFYGVRRGFALWPALADGIGMALRRYQCHDLVLMRLSNATLATAAIQMALPVVNGFIVFPLYGLARRTVGRRAALWAVTLYPLVPSFALWAGRWDQFYPLLTCTAWYCFHRGLSEKQRRWLFLSGLALAAALFCTFGPIALLAPLGLAALFWLSAHPARWQVTALMLDAAVFFAGVSLPWFLYRAIFGVSGVDIWRISMSYHLGLDRAYWTWVIFHLYDFCVFLGLPLTLGWGQGLVRTTRKWIHSVVTSDKHRLYAPVPRAAIPLGFTLGLLLLDLSGTARGEVARVWLFLTPFAVLSAAYGLTHWDTPRSVIAPAALLLLAGQLLVFNAFLRVVTTGISDPPSRSNLAGLPAEMQPQTATLGETIALLGYTVTPETAAPGDTVHLTLYWQARAQTALPYTVFTHLVASEAPPDTLPVAQQDGMPQQGAAPTSCWAPGELLSDTHTVTIPADARPGRYTWYVGMYDLPTLERLPAHGAGALSDNRIQLATPLPIAPAPGK